MKVKCSYTKIKCWKIRKAIITHKDKRKTTKIEKQCMYFDVMPRRDCIENIELRLILLPMGCQG